MTPRDDEQAAEKTFRWVTVQNHDELEAFYRSILPKIREAAKECGYAVGAHGSLRRDLDLIAVPWREDRSNKDDLARKIHRTVCGIESESYQWEQKPAGRVATCFPICFPEWNERNLGHIDLSVADGAAWKEQQMLAKLRSASKVTAHVGESLMAGRCWADWLESEGKK